MSADDDYCTQTQHGLLPGQRQAVASPLTDENMVIHWCQFGVKKRQIFVIYTGLANSARPGWRLHTVMII